MTAVEVIELGAAPLVELVYEPDDPIAGAEVVSVSNVQMPPGAPVGPAGGVLSGTYPNPGFAVNMATQDELESTADSRVAIHRYDDHPHPAYDDMASLTLLYENGLI